MAKLVVIEYKPSRLKGLAASALGLVFISLAISKALSEAPLAVRALTVLMGIVGVAAGVWNLVVGPRLASTLRRFSDMVKLEDDKLVFSRPIKLRRGYLRVEHKRERRRRASDRSRPSMHLSTLFEESEEEREAETLGPEDFQGDFSAIAGLSWALPGLIGVSMGDVGVSVGAASVVVEWVKAPGYEVIDPEYRVPLASIVVALLPRVEHEISLVKQRLAVSRDRDVGMAELRVVDGTVEGVLSYSKPLEGKSKAVKLELEVVMRGVRYKTTIARLDRPGSMEFRWSPGMEEDVYIVMTDMTTISPRRLVERLGVEKPLFAGKAWDAVSEAKLRLVLEIPMARDVVDEAGIIVKPVTRSQATS